MQHLLLSLVLICCVNLSAPAQVKAKNTVVNKEKIYKVTGKWTKANTAFVFLFTGELRIKDGIVTGYLVWSVDKVDPGSANYYKDRMSSSAKEYVEGRYDAVKNTALITGVKEEDPAEIISADTYELNFMADNLLTGKGKGLNDRWDGRLNGSYTIETSNTAQPAAGTDQPKPDTDKTLFTNINFTGKPGNLLTVKELYQSDLTYIRFAYPNGNFRINTRPEMAFYIYDAKTGTKYMCRNTCKIPLNQTVSGKTGTHYFVLGFEKIPAGLKNFEIYEGEQAKEVENSWWLNVSLDNAYNKQVTDYETEFAVINERLLNNTYTKTDIEFIDRNEYIPMKPAITRPAIEDSLKNSAWSNLQYSAFKKYFEEVVGFNTKNVEYKGNLKDGLAMLREAGSNDFTIQGYFINGALNGYGRIYKKSTGMLSTIEITLEGNFVNNRLHGLGTAGRRENMNNKEHRGYFYNGKFIVNENIGAIDDKGNLVILLNKGICRFYPEIQKIRYGYGFFYPDERAYGIDIALDNSIYGSQTVTDLAWTGGCSNGFADGYGMIKLKGTSSDNFTNTEKGYENEVFYGSFKKGFYDNCKIFNFIDLATSLVAGKNARKYLVFENGVLIGEDLSEVSKVNREYNRNLQKFEAEQKEFESNYQLVVSKPNIASVYYSDPGLSGAGIYVEDGGDIVFGSNISNDGYTTTVFDRNNKVVKVYNDPGKDNGIGAPALESHQLPGKVVVNYKVNGEARQVTLKVLKGGSYTLKIR